MSINNFEYLKDKIAKKEPLDSVEEFKDLAHSYPEVIMQVPNSLELALQLWNQSTLSERDYISDLIEDSDLSEDFNEKLGFPKQGKFFYNKGIWSCDKLSYFKVDLDAPTQERLNNLSMKIEVPLSLSESKVATFEVQANPVVDFFNSQSKKALQLTLGISLLGFAAINTNAISTMGDLFKPKSALELDIRQSLPDVINQLQTQIQSSKHPHLMNLKNQLGNFDFKFYLKNMQAENPAPSEAMIEEMIYSFYESKNPAHLDKIKLFVPKIAKAIIKHTQNNHIDYRLLLSILKVESDFNQSFVSTTKDYSIAQVNYAIWSEEFMNKKNIKLDKERLKKDIDYSIDIMTQIISILEKRHSQDPYWYARYHSSTPSLKLKYAGKVDNVLGSLKLEEYNYHQTQLKELKILLKSINEEVADSENLNYESIQNLVAHVGQLEKTQQENNNYQVALK